jgi:PIN domain nuclease of toxin-antitoxin system
LNLLLDTHAIIWWFAGSPALPATARAAIYENPTTIFVSAVSAFEISLKHHRGRLPRTAALVLDFERMVAGEGFHSLAVTFEHALLAGALDIPHRDPFDRLLIAQAMHEQFVLVSNERVFDAFGVNRLW